MKSLNPRRQTPNPPWEGYPRVDQHVRLEQRGYEHTRCADKKNITLTLATGPGSYLREFTPTRMRILVTSIKVSIYKSESKVHTIVY